MLLGFGGSTVGDADLKQEQYFVTLAEERSPSTPAFEMIIVNPGLIKPPVYQHGRFQLEWKNMAFVWATLLTPQQGADSVPCQW